MRLTLRTLLAYIDDTLPPAQAKEIGGQIGGVPEAAMLMQKLRDVIRKRRLLAPNLSGQGSGPDPNLIGEYLESSLPPAAVVELEQLCYRSDMHLAEVAACHKILTLVLGEPVEVPQDMRERMYALGSSTRPPVPAPSTVHIEEPAPASAATATTLFEEGIPDYLKRPDNSRRWLTAAVVLLIAGTWVSLSIPELNSWWGTGQTLTQNAPAVSDELLNIESPNPSDRPAVELDETKPANEVAATSPESVARVEPQQTALPERQAGPELPNVEVVAMPAPQLPMPAQPVVVEEPVIPALPISYLANDDILLSRRVDDFDWMIVPSPQILETKRYYAVPVPFTAGWNVGEGTLLCGLRGGTLIQLLPLQQGEHLAIEMDRGRLELRRSGDEVPRIRLIVDHRIWLLELLDPETLIGIEVDLPAAQGLPGTAPPLVLDGGIQALAGTCRISTPQDPEGTILTPTSGRNTWSSAAANPVLPSLNWLTETTLITTVAQRNAREFMKEFMPSATVENSITSVVDSRLETMSEFAVQTMALTDTLPGLVRGLQSEHESTRLMAISAIQRWLPRDPENELILAEELGRSFRTAEVDLLVRMLWGYTAANGRDPEISQMLVDQLDHEHVAVRELAFYHVARLSGRKYDYRPLLPASQRAAAEQRWQSHLQRFGALAE